MGEGGEVKREFFEEKIVFSFGFQAGEGVEEGFTLGVQAGGAVGFPFGELGVGQGGFEIFGLVVEKKRRKARVGESGVEFFH